jgi:serine/threonine-protein kinase
MSELSAGTMVTPSLKLERLIGEGAMGSVWVADHLGLECKVAVKFITPVRLRDKPALAVRFEREAKAAARIKSPHVVQVHDHGLMSDNTPFIVMELLEGETLGARLKRGPLPLAEVGTVVSHVGKALAKAHELGIVHRDIKPENIFLLASDDDLHVKVLDFGIAKQVEEPGQTMTQTGAILGTPMYMSPERIKSARDADYPADLWALAVVAYECVTGRTPFMGETVGALFFAICGDPLTPPSELRDGVPKALDDWFGRALRHEPDRRFGSARELAAAFRAALGFPVEGQPLDQTLAIPEAASPNDAAEAALATGEFVSQRELDVATDPPISPAPEDVRPRNESPAVSDVTVKSDDGTSTTLPGADRKEPTGSAAPRRRIAPLAAAAVVLGVGTAAWFGFARNREPDKVEPAALAVESPQSVAPSASAASLPTDGVSAPAPASAASGGSASEDDLLGVMAATRPAFERCYEDARRNDSSVKGTVSIAVVIEQTGRPSDVIVGGAKNKGMRECIRKEVAKLSFPRPAARTGITYPLALGAPRVFGPAAQESGASSSKKAAVDDNIGEVGAARNEANDIGKGYAQKKIKRLPSSTAPKAEATTGPKTTFPNYDVYK